MDFDSLREGDIKKYMQQALRGMDDLREANGSIHMSLNVSLDEAGKVVRLLERLRAKAKVRAEKESLR